MELLLKRPLLCDLHWCDHVHTPYYTIKIFPCHVAHSTAFQLRSLLKKHGHLCCVTADLSPTASFNGSIASTIVSCGMQFVKASSVFESKSNGQCLVPIRGTLGAGQV